MLTVIADGISHRGGLRTGPRLFTRCGRELRLPAPPPWSQLIGRGRGRADFTFIPIQWFPIKFILNSPSHHLRRSETTVSRVWPNTSNASCTLLIRFSGHKVRALRMGSGRASPFRSSSVFTNGGHGVGEASQTVSFPSPMGKCLSSPLEEEFGAFFRMSRKRPQTRHITLSVCRNCLLTAQATN